MKKPKKPKFARYPKKPKATASLETMKNWQHRCGEVDKRNAEKAKIYNNKIDEIKKAKSLRASINGTRSKPKLHVLKSL